MHLFGSVRIAVLRCAQRYTGWKMIAAVSPPWYHLLTYVAYNYNRREFIIQQGIIIAQNLRIILSL